MNILNWLDLAVHLYWRVQVTSKVAASGLLHWISQTGCHEDWTGFGLAPALLLELTRGVELPQRLSTWAGEVRQSDGLSYRLCRVSVAKDGPSEALALYDL